MAGSSARSDAGSDGSALDEGVFDESAAEELALDELPEDERDEAELSKEELDAARPVRSAVRRRSSCAPEGADEVSDDPPRELVERPEGCKDAVLDPCSMEGECVGSAVRAPATPMTATMPAASNEAARTVSFGRRDLLCFPCRAVFSLRSKRQWFDVVYATMFPASIRNKEFAFCHSVEEGRDHEPGSGIRAENHREP